MDIAINTRNYYAPFALEEQHIELFLHLMQHFMSDGDKQETIYPHNRDCGVWVSWINLDKTVEPYELVDILSPFFENVFIVESDRDALKALGVEYENIY